VLKQAKKYLSARQFQKVISLLEPKVLEYRDDFVFYKYLAFAYLYLGDYGGAEAYVRRARHLSSDDPEVGMALAALFLRRREFTKALQIWLEIRSQFPEHKGARRALELAKKPRPPKGTTSWILGNSRFSYRHCPGVSQFCPYYP
jgi:tetratricopeptide (TPR) repeat protein